MTGAPVATTPTRPHYHNWRDRPSTIEAETVWRVRDCRCGRTQYARATDATWGDIGLWWRDPHEAVEDRRAELADLISQTTVSDPHRWVPR